jgi:hypothetical protein
MDRFLLADNPLNEDGSEAIIHTINPISIIEVYPDSVEFKEGTYYQHFEYEGEPFTFRLHHLFSTELDSEQHSAIVQQLFERAWRWYVSVLKEFDNEEE